MKLPEKLQEIDLLLENYSGKRVPFEIREFNQAQSFDRQFADLSSVICIDIEEE